MRVRVFGSLRQVASDKEFDVAPACGTVRGLLELLQSGQPALAARILCDEGTLENSVNVLVNGRNIKFLGDLDAPVNEEDQIAIFPAVGGG